jgi:hypothetical protein
MNVPTPQSALLLSLRMPSPRPLSAAGTGLPVAGHRKPPWVRRVRRRKAVADQHLATAQALAVTAQRALAEQCGKLAAEQPLHHRITELARDSHLPALVREIAGG